MKKQYIFAIVLILCLITVQSLTAGQISFSGGYTKVNMQEGAKSILLTGGASVNSDGITLRSDSIELYGTDYRYVWCEGNVNANDEEHGISFISPNMFYDRESSVVTTDSWIEVQDTKNQAALSGAWFRYDIENRIITLKIMAKVMKVTDQGLMICRADSIEYDGKDNRAVLKGGAEVMWNNGRYVADIIIVDLDTNEITLHGSISGEFDG